jgi:hypothetical protein
MAVQPAPPHRPGLEPFGPFRDIDPVERVAQLRTLRTLVRVFARDRELEAALHAAETNDAHRARALIMFDALPAVRRRNVLATFAYIHRPLYSSSRKATEQRNASC